MELLNHLGECLKMLRTERGKKQREIAEILGMTLRNYQRFEHGEINIPATKLSFFADFYHVTVDFLLGRSLRPRHTDSDTQQRDNTETLKILGGRLRALRLEKGLHQKDIAEFLGVTCQHYQRMEYGKINVPSLALCTLADYFGVSADYLLGQTDERESDI